MALTEEEIKRIAKCKIKCIWKGIDFKNAISPPQRVAEYPTELYPIHVADMVQDSDLIVPHSALAKDVGAAGKQILAWALREDIHYAHIVFDNGDGCCEHTHGPAHELMSPRLIGATVKLFYPKGLEQWDSQEKK
jgi:hypothetical protein